MIWSVFSVVHIAPNRREDSDTMVVADVVVDKAVQLLDDPQPTPGLTDITSLQNSNSLKAEIDGF